MKFVGWVVDATGKVIGELWASSGFPGCFVVVVGICVSCYCIWANFAVGIGYAADFILPESWTASPVALQIKSGNAPISINAIGHKCNSNVACAPFSLDFERISIESGGEYIEIWLTNEAPRDSQASFYTSRVYFPSHIDIEISCVNSNGRNDVHLEPKQIGGLICIPSKVWELPEDRVCVETTYSEQIHLGFLPNDSPMRADICSDVSQ